jgi:hypothetical protein
MDVRQEAPRVIGRPQREFVEVADRLTVAVPEPCNMVLVGSGILGLAAMRLRRRKTA